MEKLSLEDEASDLKEDLQKNIDTDILKDSLISDLNSTSNINCIVTQNEVPVCQFFLEGKCRFGDKCRNSHPTDCGGTVAKASPKTKRHPISKKKTKFQEEDASPLRKPSMKTAENVISRVLWDEKLPEENFTIGYLDRFKGILEKPFIFFSWEDLASVDNYVLAIPKHRIQYFKYRGFKVWDKNERLDYMFGSTGNEPNIYDYVRKINSDLEKNPELEVITVPEEDMEVKESFREPGHVERVRPTHFISIRIRDPDILKTAKIIKDYVQKHEPCYKDYCIPDDSLHITMALMKLDYEEVPFAVEVFESMWNELEKNCDRQFELQVKGLDTFGRHVLYGKVESESSFHEFAESSLETLRKSGIRLVLGDRGFHPHLTLWKSSKNLVREKRYIDPLLFQNFTETHFGTQIVDNLHFCIVGEEKAEDGFYKCLGSKTLVKEVE